MTSPDREYALALLHRLNVVPAADTIALAARLAELVEGDIARLTRSEAETASMWHSILPGALGALADRICAGDHRKMHPNG